MSATATDRAAGLNSGMLGCHGSVYILADVHVVLVDLLVQSGL